MRPSNFYMFDLAAVKPGTWRLQVLEQEGWLMYPKINQDGAGFSFLGWDILILIVPHHEGVFPLLSSKDPLPN